MTVVGAAGGAVAGNNVERNINKRVVGYRVTVRLDGVTAGTRTALFAVLLVAFGIKAASSSGQPPMSSAESTDPR